MPEGIVFENTEGEDNCDDELHQYSSDEGGSERSQDPHQKKMKELEERLEAIAHRCDLQDVGVVRPYPAEWDSTPYPPKFKAPTLQAFDGKTSPINTSTILSLKLEIL